MADILWPRMQGAGGDDSLTVLTSPCLHSIALVHQRWGWCPQLIMQCFAFFISQVSSHPRVREGKQLGAELWDMGIAGVTLWSYLSWAVIFYSSIHLNFLDLCDHVPFPSSLPLNLVLSFPTDTILSLPKLGEV